MSIDIERLKRDRAYWDEVAPEEATHYQPETRLRYAGWMKSDGVGNWKLAFDKNDGWGDDDSPGEEAIPRPEPANEWDDCTAPDWATHYCNAHKAWRNSKIDVIADCCIPLPKRSTEWDGDLPPAGTVCEVSNCGQPYEWCKVRFMGETLCVVDHAKYVEQHYHLRSVTFRPIHTKAERDKKELNDIIDAAMRSGDGDAASAILAAGWQKPD